MAESILDKKYFHDPDEARKHLESQVWPNGPECPHCGSVDEHYQLKGKTTRPGLYKCKDCREPFTVTVGTIFEGSKVPLNKWLLAVYYLCSSKKGMSSHQLHRTLGVTYKTAWFMTHRIREAFAPRHEFKKMGGGGSIVEADETYWGTSKKALADQKKRGVKQHGGHDKMKIVALVERGGNTRTFHVHKINATILRDILTTNVQKDTRLMTDEAMFYRTTGRTYFMSHERVNHSAKEYSRGDVTTNNVEGYFSLLKRGLIGTYHHVGEQHLQRYVNEFDFRFNNRKVSDMERTDNALKGIVGKRLTYRRPYGETAPY